LLTKLGIVEPVDELIAAAKHRIKAICRFIGKNGNVDVGKTGIHTFNELGLEFWQVREPKLGQKLAIDISAQPGTQQSKVWV